MHDLIEYHHDSQTKKKLIFRKIAYPYVCSHADKIITVSESTKRDIINYLGIIQDKIEVAYNGKDDDLIPIEKLIAREYIKRKYGIENYIFYIGYLTHPQKNLIYLIDEYARFYEMHPDVKLVFAGPKGKNAEQILQHAKTILPSNAFSYIGKVPYGDLKYLYSGCEIFCFPSLFEGFGMPVLEAMSCGAVVIASNRSSIPEILDDDVFLFDPECPTDLYNMLMLYYGKDNSNIQNNNINRAKLFTWSEHGNVLSAVVNKII